MDANHVKLKRLVHRRDQVLKLLTQERNRLQQIRDEEIRELIQAAIDFYTRQKKDLEAQMKAALAGMPDNESGH